MYVEWCGRFDIRADIVWAMMRLETADLRFGGQVPATFNNFCGLRKPDGSGFYRFTTPSDGVVAHVAHVAWHVYPEHYNEYCSRLYDPKHSDHPNDVKVLADLDVWATTGYAKKVLARVNEGV